MSTSTAKTALPDEAAAAVTEAARIAGQAARQGTETVRQSIDVARVYSDETAQLGGELLRGWVAQTEAMLKAGFEAQNAAIEAELSGFDLWAKSYRQGVEQLGTFVRQTQQATLEGWRAAAQVAAKVTTGTTPGAGR